MSVQLLYIVVGLVGDKLPRFADQNYNEQSYFDDWISKGSGIEGETDGYPFW